VSWRNVPLAERGHIACSMRARRPRSYPNIQEALLRRMIVQAAMPEPAVKIDETYRVPLSVMLAV
jgi:hypothetical protein